MTRQDKVAPKFPDLLKRDFTAPGPNVKWCGDITEIPTDEGKLYMATVLDLFSRRLLAVPTSEYLKAEAYYAASHEGALHLDDVLTRRTRISIEVPDRCDAAAAEVADLIAPLLDWTPEHVRQEVEHYRLRVKAERESQEQSNDQTADSARLGAPDVRLGAVNPV